MTNLKKKLIPPTLRIIKMWIVILANNVNFLNKELIKKISNPEIYFPKTKLKKNKDKNILGNYLFCYSKNFSSSNNLLYEFRNLKGLKKILFADKLSQKEISNFVDYCKSHEDESGYIQNSFFKKNILSKGKITTGPFSNYIFDIISKEKKRIKAIIGDIKFSISDNNKSCYSSI